MRVFSKVKRENELTVEELIVDITMDRTKILISTKFMPTHRVAIENTVPIKYCCHFLSSACLIPFLNTLLTTLREARCR